MSVNQLTDMNDDMADEDVLSLNERVGDWVAGDLSDQESAEMEALLKSDPDLAHEADLCRALQTALPSAARPAHIRPPGSGMANVLRQRLQNERSSGQDQKPSAKVIPFKSSRHIIPWLVAAAACVVAALSLISVRDSGLNGNAYYDEFGAMIQPLSNSIDLPQTVSLSDNSAPTLDGAVQSRPWLGVHSKPIALEGFERSYGLLLVNVTENSPAAKAGLRRGDVILDLGTMPLSTRWCIPHALEDLQPEQTVSVNYWREGELKPLSTDVTLGHCSDLLKH